MVSADEAEEEEWELWEKNYMSCNMSTTAVRRPVAATVGAVTASMPGGGCGGEGEFLEAAMFFISLMIIMVSNSDVN